ncbi:hydrogenase maturation protease [Lignipirellula cremea]|uniref:Hydrogenase 2 maturation protease n=1 Tax=Lignipirellula cremea TaxID=2528010 RepID=A0A518E4Z3_9BACT|nr:hydrogenase maturation protease [Lignipirellula cremea]QDU99170.1 Hydrogenase 2 maturation protease [Lignipirellula cremea]
MPEPACPPSILLAGIGNIFQADDAFGSEVARRLADRSWPAGVKLVDYGIRAIDLTYALLEPRDLTILIDAVSRGGPPGALYLIEPDLDVLQTEARATAPALDGHTMDPLQVLRAVALQGGLGGRLLLVGCEPGDLGGEEGRMGLTAPVQAAVVEACDMVASLVADFAADPHTQGKARHA